jgi:predicted nucleotide-binding protein
MNYKVLAWDDDPDENLLKLIDRLKHFGVGVELVRERDEFLDKFEKDDWHFVMLDVIDTTSDPEYPRTRAGIDLAERVRRRNKRIPIIFITSEGSILAKETPTPGPVLYRSKDNPLSDLVNDIMDFAKANVFDSQAVFLIYGHDRKAGNLRADLVKRLKGLGLDVKSITPEESMVSLSTRLIEKMSQCGGFIAICTPDDKVVSDDRGGDEWYQPRQNVLLEIGIAMGMSRGLERLITLQRWGNDPSEMALLPSDLAGSLTIRFYDANNYKDALDALLRGLSERGLRIQEGKS